MALLVGGKSLLLGWQSADSDKLIWAFAFFLHRDFKFGIEVATDYGGGGVFAVGLCLGIGTLRFMYARGGVL